MHQIYQSIHHAEMSTNSSTHYYILSEYISHTWARPILLYLNPTVTILGLLGNLFCFVTILYRKLYRKSPVWVFLLYLAFADFLHVIGDGVYTHEYQLNLQFHSRYNVACQCLLFVSHTGLVASSWILVAVTSYKLYGMTRPLDMLKQDGSWMPYIICSLIIAIVACLKINVFWTTGVVIDDITPDVTILMCFYPDPYVASRYSTAFMIAYSVGPGCLLALLSIGIISSFVVSYRKHKRLRSDSNRSRDTQMASYHRTASRLSPFATANNRSSSKNNSDPLSPTNKPLSKTQSSPPFYTNHALETDMILLSPTGKYDVNSRLTSDEFSSTNRRPSTSSNHVLDINNCPIATCNSPLTTNNISSTPCNSVLEDVPLNCASYNNALTRNVQTASCNHTLENSNNVENTLNNDVLTTNNSVRNENFPTYRKLSSLRRLSVSTTNLSSAAHNRPLSSTKRMSASTNNLPKLTEKVTLSFNRSRSREAPSTYTTAKNSITMLLPLSLLHIVCTLPLLIYISLYSDSHSSPEFFFLTDRFWLLNHSMNVYVQLAISRFYRQAMLPCLFKR